MCVLCPCTANHAMHSAQTHCVNQHCFSLYVLYSARNVFKTIIGCDCYPLLVLRLPNDFLFNSEPKVDRWDPLHQYWTTKCTGGGRQHGWVGWMSGSEGRWVECGWDAYGPRSRGAV